MFWIRNSDTFSYRNTEQNIGRWDYHSSRCRPADAAPTSLLRYRIRGFACLVAKNNKLLTEFPYPICGLGYSVTLGSVIIQV